MLVDGGGGAGTLKLSAGLPGGVKLLNKLLVVTQKFSTAREDDFGPDFTTELYDSKNLKIKKATNKNKRKWASIPLQ